MIVPVDEGNLSEAAAVYAASWRASHEEICTRAFLDKHTAAYQAQALREKMRAGWLLFALYEEQCAGVVGVHPASGEIGLLYVDPALWGKGYGSRLLHFAVQRMAGRTGIFLTVLNTNERAKRLYEQRGFVFSGEKHMLNAQKGIAELKYIYTGSNTVAK